MSLKNINSIGVIGLGQMGRGIAQVLAMAGFEVLLYDSAHGQSEKALSFIQGQWKKGVDKGKWQSPEVQQWEKCLLALQSFEELKSADMVIEAVVEDLEVKSKIIRKLDEILDPKAIIASNTSSISITKLARYSHRPERVVGMHFMNPVPVMKLVEGITGLATSSEVVATVKALSEKLGKVFVEARDIPGFCVNRILMPMVNEAIAALYEGIADAKDIDNAMKLGANFPMGPLELADFIGLDTVLSILNTLAQGLGDPKYHANPLLIQYVDSGRLGRKTGRGFYDYKK